jgi:peptide/nickel transport system substrate-binding protein
MEEVPPQDIARLEASGKRLRIERFVGRNYTNNGWDSTNPLFASREVRRALGLAIDVQGIVEALCYGYARPCAGPIHPILWAHDPHLAPLGSNPDEARRILAREGWVDTDGDGVLDRDGVPFEFELKTNLGNQVRLDASVMIQSDLAKVGVKANPRTYEWTVLWDTVIRHTYRTAVLVGWNVGLKVDLKPMFHSASRAEKYNHTGYSNPAVDDLIDRALAEETLEAAGPLWRQAERLIVEDQPYTFLFILDRTYGVNDRVRGTVPDPRGFYRNLHEWWIPASKQRRRAAA